MKKPIKVTITGSAGQLAYALLFRVASGQMFGLDVPIELRLLELESALPRLRGVQMELEDCAFPWLKNVVCTADVNEAMQDASWAILIGAGSRTLGMDRAELLDANAHIFQEQGRAINQHAARDVRVLVVGNPCNTNCLVASHHAPDISPQHFYAMTMLDELRARFILAKKAAVEVAAISEMIVWGNHSSTQYPDFYHAKIYGKPSVTVIDEAWLQKDFLARVKERGAEILAARGISSGASASHAIIECVNHIIHDTDKMYSLGCYARGEYGVDEGLFFSYPCVTQTGEVKIITGIEHHDFARQQLAATLAELKKEKEMVRRLGFLD